MKLQSKFLLRRFHKLLGLYSKVKSNQLQAKLKIEVLKARNECAKFFWTFVSKILDEEDRNVASPTFTTGDVG